MVCRGNAGWIRRTSWWMVRCPVRGPGPGSVTNSWLVWLGSRRGTHQSATKAMDENPDRLRPARPQVDGSTCKWIHVFGIEPPVTADGRSDADGISLHALPQFLPEGLFRHQAHGPSEKILHTNPAGHRTAWRWRGLRTPPVDPHRSLEWLIPVPMSRRS